MPSTFMQAGKLLNESEFALFAASRAGVLNTLTKAGLAGKIRRARSLRDKYRDLLKRQRLATRTRTGSKAGVSGVANQRTRQKAEIFAQVLQRLEKRLAQVEAAEARAASRKASAQTRSALSRKRRADAAKLAARRRTTSPKAPAKSPSRITQGPQPTAESARSARHAMQFKVAGQQAIHGHVSARGRRNQAKRDSRG